MQGMKATSREWIGLAVLVLPCIIYAMDLTVLMLAVPQLIRDLQPSAVQLLWITDIYGFVIAGLLITMGTLGDRVGRRRLLMIGGAFFAVGSILAAFAPTAETLIAARALLGLAGATLAPSTLSLIRNMFHDDNQRTFAIGVWIAGFSAGGALGPVIGGVLLEFFWWGSVFLIALPVMALLLILGPILLPESKDPNAGRLEIFSALLSLVTILSFIFGIKKIAEGGFEWAYAAFIMGSVLMGMAFVKRQKRLPDPMIDVAMFTIPGFAPALLINIVGLFVAFGYFLVSAQYLQMVMGLTPLMAGIWSLPTGLAFIVGSLVTPSLAQRFRRVNILVCGFVLASLGFLILTQASVDMPLWLFITGLFVFCAGFAPIGTLTTDMVMSIAPPERAGAASAISETSFELGGAVGIAVVGSIIMVLYRGMMMDTMPADLPADAFESLGGALHVAETMTEEAGRSLVANARESFAAAMRWIAWISVGASLLAATLAFTLLRRYQKNPVPSQN